MGGVECDLELGHPGGLRLEPVQARELADPPCHVDVLLGDPQTVLMGAQRHVDDSVGQLQIGMVAAGLGDLRHRGDESRRSDVVRDRVTRVQSLGQPTSIIETRIGDLPVAESLHGLDCATMP